MWRKPAEAKALRSVPNVAASMRMKPHSVQLDAGTPSPIKLQVAPWPASHDQGLSESETPSAIAPVDSGPSMIGAGLKIRGDFLGSSDLLIEGEAQGKIRVPGARVTIGAGGRVVADIDAREIIIDGSAQGNMKATENIRLGPSSRVQGSLVTLRIGIEDGARLRGKVETTRLPDSQGALPLESPEESDALGKVSERAENE
jgi:cytoskeletal protein CcmA (bactofilin family)